MLVQFIKDITNDIKQGDKIALVIAIILTVCIIGCVVSIIYLVLIITGIVPVSNVGYHGTRVIIINNCPFVIHY